MSLEWAPTRLSRRGSNCGSAADAGWTARTKGASCDTWPLIRPIRGPRSPQTTGPVATGLHGDP